MADGYAPAGEHWIFYREEGNGHAVVFVHAGVADSRMWYGQLGAVPDGFRYVTFDQRGFGKTEVGDIPFESHRDVLALMDHLSIESAVLVGCSRGGGTVLDVAIAEPGRVRGLVLVGADSPGFEPSQPFESPQWPEAVREYEAGNLERVAELDAEIWLAGNGRDIAVVDPELTKLFVEMDLVALRNEEERDRLEQKGPDRVAGTQGISQPSLVIVGEYDLPTLREAADDLAAKLAGEGPAVVIGDSAHLPGFERPAEFNEVLTGFLTRLT